MPLNTLRLNHAPSSHPNERIVFIKPLKRPTSQQQDYETADLLLRAIAAQCLPIMKSNYLSVTTLEEHEPNPEFIGRNFNNGEVIQLVLRSKNGSWLSVKMIQMVMMHELAHNVHMNHSRKFWETRNKFAAEMRCLWDRGYTGDGLWGSGRILGDLQGEMTGGNGIAGSAELENLPLCGGTFRSRGGKRRRKRNATTGGENTTELSWREKKQRRIEKKFGKNGLALGEDEDKRMYLEALGKGPLGVKPRVAQSKRGRELRAAAALARFGSNKKEVETLEKLKSEEEGEEVDSEGTVGDIGDEYEYGDDNDDDDDDDENINEEDARDYDGKRLLDQNGRGMIRICGQGEEEDDAIQVKQEMDELEGIDFDMIPLRTGAGSDKKQRREQDNVSSISIIKREKPEDREADTHSPTDKIGITSAPATAIEVASNTNTDIKIQQKDNGSINLQEPSSRISKVIAVPTPRISTPGSASGSLAVSAKATPPPPRETETEPRSRSRSRSEIKCPICTTTQATQTATASITCTTCSNVLYPEKDPRHWYCTSEICRELFSESRDTDSKPKSKPKYINPGDFGVCGICGVRKGG